MGFYDSTLGTLLVGIFLNTFLYGLVTYQFAAYHQTKFNDPPATRYMVLFLYLLDTFHSISAIYMAWYYTVESLDNPSMLEQPVWPYQFTPLGTALAALVTQIYLGYRIWRLTNSKVFYVVIITLAIPSFVMGTGCSIAARVISVMSKLPLITPLVIAWLSTQVITDAFITIILIVVFTRSRTGSPKMDVIINRIIRGAVQTGLLAGIFAIGDLISFIMLPNMNLYGMFAIPIGRIYTNTLLDTLLCRETFRAEMADMYQAKCAVAPSKIVGTTASPRARPGAVVTSIQLEGRRSEKEACDQSSSEHAGDDAISETV